MTLWDREICNFRNHRIMSKYLEPEINANSFTCPNCETLASMQWLWVIDEISRLIKPNYGNYQICLGSVHTFLFQHFPQVHPSKLAIARCSNCGELTIWVNGKLVFPVLKGIKPNQDMPEQAKQIFIESQDVLSSSPRAACMLARLCLEELLNAVDASNKKRKLFEKINHVAPEGSVLKTVLNACRLTGNKFVHEGTFDALKECDMSPEQLACALSSFINLATEQLISIPKQAKSLERIFTSKKKS